MVQTISDLADTETGLKCTNRAAMLTCSGEVTLSQQQSPMHTDASENTVRSMSCLGC